ncbi:EF-hand domain-containing protein [Verrucomicrobiaceae bacterium N1E253]|uniref:EF-hand domain-containing protein n=2 Tax=Oceaniferula marina TaxID=2748318 RepID=A0A851GGR4_9BACT|nr:EF-hand domain-containing protein [Oceaniferula marina]
MGDLSAFPQEKAREGDGRGAERKGGKPRPGQDRPGRPDASIDFKALDLDGDGFLTFEEFSQSPRLARIDDQKRRRLFSYLDRNKDGKLDMSELKPKPPRWTKSIEDEFDQHDTDKSGAIDYEEFSKISFFAKMEDAERRRMFRRLDRNQDQKIQKGEVKRAMHGPGRGMPHLDIHKYDTNQSGGLDYSEYSSMPWVDRIPEERRKLLFERLDVDGDGEIKPEDIRRAHDRMRRHGPHPNEAKPRRGKGPHGKGPSTPGDKRGGGRPGAQGGPKGGVKGGAPRLM